MSIKITPLLDTLYLQKISDEEYFSEVYKNYISNSRLGLINPAQDGSPEKFFSGFKPVYSQSFSIGSGVHQLSLQNHLYEICQTVDLPTAKVGAIGDRLYNIYKEKGEVSDEEICKEAGVIDYYHGLLTKNQILNVREKCKLYWESRKQVEESYDGEKELLFFDLRSRDTVINCVNALNNNKYIQNLLHPTGIIENPISECEQAVLLDIKVEINDKSFILKLKAKLDNYTIDKENNIITVNDVKTLGRLVSEMNSNIEKYRYNREISFYSWLLSLCAKKFYGIDNPTIKGNYLVVSTIPQYYTKVIPMTKGMFIEGWEEFKYLLHLVISNIDKCPEFAIWI